MSKHNQNYKANRRRKICITSIERNHFVIIWKNAIMKKEFGFHWVGVMETKDKIFESANVNMVRKLNSGVKLSKEESKLTQHRKLYNEEREKIRKDHQRRNGIIKIYELHNLK